MDGCVADIYQIRVLEAPLFGSSGPVTPKEKKRTLRTDPLTLDLLPMKKLRRAA